MKRTHQKTIFDFLQTSKERENPSEEKSKINSYQSEQLAAATTSRSPTPPAPSACSPEPSPSCSSSTSAPHPQDIGLYVGEGKKLTHEKKVSALREIWKPNNKYRFPSENCRYFKRKFQTKWLDSFKWLAYSEVNEGAFCKYCVLFLESDYGGKGRHEVLGQLVSRPCKKWKDALEIF